MHVDFRRRGFHGVYDRKIGLAGVAGADSALQANLSSAARPSLLHPPGNLAKIEIIGLVAMPEVVPSLGESTKFASVSADVRVVNVAVDDISHATAHAGLSQAIGGAAHGREIRASGVEQGFDLGLARHATVRNSIKAFSDGWRGLRIMGPQALNAGGRQSFEAAGRPAVLARKAAPLRQAQHRRLQLRRDPALWLGGKAGINRKALHENAPCPFGCSRERLQMRPGRFGIDVIGRHGRYPAPVIDA